MTTQEKIQLIEALTKVVNANKHPSDESMFDWANKEIKELTESMTKSKSVTEGNKEPKPSINLNRVEDLLLSYVDASYVSKNRKQASKEYWREEIGYTLDDLK